jgi:hypothetical protein
MNFITSDMAYSLYPYATFVLKHALSFASPSLQDQAAIRKYACRGWTFTSNRLPMDTDQAYQWFKLSRRRRLTDRYVWRVPLSSTETETLPLLQLTPTTQTLQWDPTLPCSWFIGRSKDQHGWKMTPFYLVVKPSIFKYSYVVGNRERVLESTQFFRDQGTIEYAKVADADGEGERNGHEEEDAQNFTDEAKSLRWKWFVFR